MVWYILLCYKECAYVELKNCFVEEREVCEQEWNTICVVEGIEIKIDDDSVEGPQVLNG